MDWSVHVRAIQPPGKGKHDTGLSSCLLQLLYWYFSSASRWVGGACGGKRRSNPPRVRADLLVVSILMDSFGSQGDFLNETAQMGDAEWIADMLPLRDAILQ